MTALILAQVPDPDVPATVAADQLSLIRMNDHVVHGNSMTVISLNVTSASIPYFDCAIF